MGGITHRRTRSEEKVHTHTGLGLLYTLVFDSSLAGTPRLERDCRYGTTVLLLLSGEGSWDDGTGTQDC